MRVTVIGTGRLGLLVGQVLARYRCKLTMIGRNPRTLAIAEQFGLDARGVGDVARRGDQDVVVECSGAPEGLRLAQELVRPRGTIVLKSTYHGKAAVDMAPFVVDEITLVGSRCGPFAPALASLASGEVDPRPLVEARYPLADAVAAFDHAARPGALNVLVEC